MVTLRIHQECEVRDPTPHIHRKVIRYPPMRHSDNTNIWRKISAEKSQFSSTQIKMILMSQTEYIGRSSDTFPCNGVTVIANNIWNRLEREENIYIILSSSKQKNNMVVDHKDLFLARAKILLAAVHMSTSTQWSARSPLKTRIGNKSNFIYSLKFSTSSH